MSTDEMTSLRRAGFGVATALFLALACAPTPGPAPAAPAAPAVPAAPAGEQPKYGGVLKTVFGGSSSAPHFDGQAVFNAGIYRVATSARENLFSYKAGADIGPLDWVIEPQLAEKWEQPDPKTFVITLRKGIQWTDGKPFVAKDVEFSFTRLAGKPESQQQHLADWCVPMQIVDDYTIRCNLKEPLASSILLTRMADQGNMIMSPQLSDEEMKNKLLGTGPFILKEYTRDVVWKYTKNPNYWQKGLPYLDQLETYFIGDASARLAALRAGQLDMEDTNLKVSQIATLKQTNPNLKTECWPTGGNGWFRLNLARPPMDDIRVRRALSLAVDRDAIGKAVWGEPLVYNPIVPANMKQWALPDPQKNLPYNRFDTEKAKQLLAEAGYGPNNPLKVEGIVSQQLVNYLKYMEIAKDHWSRVNVEMDLKVMEHTAAFATQPQRAFQIYAQGSRQLFDPDDYVGEWFLTKGSRNYGGWGNAEVDRLIEKQRTARSDKERQEALWEIQKIVGEQVWVITFIDGNTCMAWQPYVKNFRPDISSNYYAGRVYWIDKG